MAEGENLERTLLEFDPRPSSPGRKPLLPNSTYILSVWETSSLSDPNRGVSGWSRKALPSRLRPAQPSVVGQPGRTSPSPKPLVRPLKSQIDDRGSGTDGRHSERMIVGLKSQSDYGVRRSCAK